MTLSLLIVTVLTALAYSAGYLMGRSERDYRRHARRPQCLTQHIEQANIDRPGNPRLN
jgi:hypothetical protein